MATILLLIALLAAGHIESKGVCKRRLDLAFVVDGSSTICGGTASCPEWESILQFCKNIVEGLNIGPDDSRVAFLTFSDMPRVEWGFDKHSSKTSMLPAIDRVVYTGGEFTMPDTDATIITKNVFNEKTGKRLGIPKVLIGITDGVEDIDVRIAPAASNVIQKAGIKVLVVCVTERCSESFAQDVAPPPKQANVNYFLVKNFLAIDDIRENLMKQICAD